MYPVSTLSFLVPFFGFGLSGSSFWKATGSVAAAEVFSFGSGAFFGSASFFLGAGTGVGVLPEIHFTRRTRRPPTGETAARLVSARCRLLGLPGAVYWGPPGEPAGRVLVA
mgnify:CR=1 FL=1